MSVPYRSSSAGVFCGDSYGGFRKYGYPQSSSIYRWDFPWTKPSSYGGPPMTMDTRKSLVITINHQSSLIIIKPPFLFHIFHLFFPISLHFYSIYSMTMENPYIPWIPMVCFFWFHLNCLRSSWPQCLGLDECFAAAQAPNLAGTWTGQGFSQLRIDVSMLQRWTIVLCEDVETLKQFGKSETTSCSWRCLIETRSKLQWKKLSE